MSNKPFSNISAEDMLDNFTKQHPQGYIDQVHSGFFDLGQTVAMILVDEYLSAKFETLNILSIDTEHKYVKDKKHILEVGIVLESVDDIDVEDSPRTVSNIKITYTEEEVTPLMDVLLSRWKRYVFESTVTAG